MALTQVSTGGIKDGQISTADLADAQITASKLHGDALDHTYTLGASGTDHYTFTGEGLTGTVNDPTLYLTRGAKYRFVNGNSSGAHPFRIQSVAGAGGTEYNTGVTNNAGAGGSTIIFEVPHDAPDVLYYICTSHATMNGIFYVTGALADGTVTTAKLADDAITDAKLANSINSAIAANTAKDLTALSASNLTSGTVPDARFPATLPAASAANLTSVPAGNLTGTVADARISALTASKLTGALPAISAASCTNIPAANITGTLPAISGANLTNLPASGKASNLIINGGMQVAQKGTSKTASGIATVDRFGVSVGGLDENPTQAQVDTASGTTPYNLGLRKAFKVTNGNQSSGAGSSDRMVVYQNLEAQDISNSGWNYTSASSYITMSFWAKSSVAQTFYFLIGTDAGTVQRYGAAMTFSSADTWTKFTYTIPGNSNLTINNDESRGLQIFWVLYRGTDNTASGFTLNQWAAYDSASRVPDMTSTWFTTNDATFELTGVQLEVGDSASDFAHERYSDTLAKCQRYFFMLAAHHQQTHDSCFGRGASLNNSVLFAFNPYYPVTMRTAPSAYTVANASPSFYLYEWNTYYHVTGNWNIHATGPHSGQVYASCQNVGGTNKVFRVQTLADQGEIGFDAEL